jgi:hypothetical protein
VNAAFVVDGAPRASIAFAPRAPNHEFNASSPPRASIPAAFSVCVFSIALRKNPGV